MPQWSVDLLIGILSVILGFISGFFVKGYTVRVKQKIKGCNNIQKNEVNNGK